MSEFRYSNVPAAFQGLFADTVSYQFGYDGTNDALLPVQNWLLRGSIREDDLGYSRIFPFVTRGIHCLSELVASTQGTEPRSLNHFYDPYFNSKLATAAGPSSKAIDWALGFTDSLASTPQIDAYRLNFYSYSDARNAFWSALTGDLQVGKFRSSADRGADAGWRMNQWATTFRALGDVLHLVEDMGQPQHTRNDTHGGPFASDEQKAFEDYTNDRVLGVTDESNSYVRSFFGNITKPFTPPPLGNYPAPMFSTPVRFFTTRGDGSDQSIRAGLADYTNRGFFTGGTLPEVTSEPSPPHPLDTSYGIVVVPCPDLVDNPQLNATSCAHYTRAVPDVVAPGYLDALPDGFTQPPLAADSVFRDIIAMQNGGTVAQIPQTAIGIAELDTMGNMTIPRAVGYATGMINFFFRGQLQLSSPPDGLYAVIDQATPHQVSSDGIPTLQDGVTTFGFKTVRVRVKNATNMDSSGNPTLIDAGYKQAVPQTMRAGTGPDGQPNGYLVAIARYHRNPCYKPDLTGEYISIFNEDGSVTNTVPAGCTNAQMRTAYQEISVSAQVKLDANGNLPGPGASSSSCANVGNVNTGAGAGTGNCANSSALLEFDFSGDPIPMNATDLFLQVAYRGQLGDETDGIAVGMVDLLEPNYISIVNNSDWWYDGANWNSEPASSQWKTTQTRVCFNSQAMVTDETLNPLEFIRLATLTDQSTVMMGSLDQAYGGPTSYSAIEYPVPRQSDRENGGVFVNYVHQWGMNFGMSEYRGVTVGVDWNAAFFQTGGTSPFGSIPLNGKAAHLQPTIGNPQGSGNPSPVQSIQFTSKPDSVCQATFLGPYPGMQSAAKLENRITLGNPSAVQRTAKSVTGGSNAGQPSQQ